ncbi:MAG: SMP-30/gluconolactonase/LRE family protein [Dethiobacteraceae bacterium]
MRNPAVRFLWRPIRQAKAQRVYQIATLLPLLIFAYMYYLGRPELPIPAAINIIGGTPAFRQVIYGGFGEDQFDRPLAVFSANNRVYVSDIDNSRVIVFDLNGQRLLTFGQRGDSGGGNLIFPYGIVADSTRIFVADLQQGRIHTFNANGEFQGFFAEAYSKNRTLRSPGALHLADGKLYVTEIKRGRVLVFDLQSQELLLEVGLEGDLFAPNGVTTDREGNIYVVDTGHGRIVVFGPDGNPLRVINGSPDGHGTSMLINPRGIGLDRFGRLIVANNMANSIAGFSLDGRHLFSFGSQGGGLTQFLFPNGLHIDQGGRIFIADSLNRRILVYQ